MFYAGEQKPLFKERIKFYFGGHLKWQFNKIFDHFVFKKTLPGALYEQA